MTTIFNSPTLLPELVGGKYSRWAEQLDSDTAQAMLIAVGEFGRRYSEMRRPDSTFTTTTFYKTFGAKFRIVLAIEALTRIYTN